MRARLVLAALLLAACGGEPTGIVLPGGSLADGDGGEGGSGATGSSGNGNSATSSGSGQTPGGAAAQLYTNTVHQDLYAACGSCHAEGAVGAPIFMHSDAALSYETMEGYPKALIHVPANSVLVLKGEHTGPALDGPGVASSLEGAVIAWLELEAEERGLVEEPSQPTGPTFDESMDHFASCMTLNDWEAAGMDLVPSQQTQGWGPCQGCHNTGVGGLFLDPSSALTFEQTKASKYRLQKYVAPEYDLENNFLGLTVATRLEDKGNEQCSFPDPDDCHPKYYLDPVVAQSIENFVNQVLGKMSNGTCAPPP